MSKWYPKILLTALAGLMESQNNGPLELHPTDGPELPEGIPFNGGYRGNGNSPTKKYFHESKARRKMAARSRRINWHK
jgi:hypothetical protein